MRTKDEMIERITDADYRTYAKLLCQGCREKDPVHLWRGSLFHQHSDLSSAYICQARETRLAHPEAFK